jgi:hypothetical protein
MYYRIITTNGIASTANSTIAQSGTWPTGISLNTTTGASVSMREEQFLRAAAYELCDNHQNLCYGNGHVTVTSAVTPITESGKHRRNRRTSLPYYRMTQPTVLLVQQQTQ